MMKRLKVGIIGLGNRGLGLLKEIVLPMEDVEVTAVCDSYGDRAQVGAEAVRAAYGRLPEVFADAEELIESPAVDTVLVLCAWEAHIPLAIRAMRAGKPAGVEVGGAYSVEACWDLVRAYEETGTPVMLLENCCFGRRELMVKNMAKLGVLGEIVFCRGGYLHDLREEVSTGIEKRHYRYRNYRSRCCENYPTHELGPIAKVLDINRGNRMVSLTSTASRAAGLNAYIGKKTGAPSGVEFAQGDVVTTVIRCARGELITLTLDTTLPRFYSRDFTVSGTKGRYEEATDSVFLDGVHNADEFQWKPQWGNAAQYEEQYDHPIWKRYLKEGARGSHDGMDYLVFRSFFESVKNGSPCPVDVYDMASWMCISALSERSIALGSQPVEIPDFTNGAWILSEENYF